jgi:hypothetical protein
MMEERRKDRITHSGGYVLQIELRSLYAECAGNINLPIKRIHNTREFRPKGQFVYFVSNLLKLHIAC